MALLPSCATRAVKELAAQPLLTRLSNHTSDPPLLLDEIGWCSWDSCGSSPTKHTLIEV